MFFNIFRKESTLSTAKNLYTLVLNRKFSNVPALRLKFKCKSPNMVMPP